MHRIMKGSYISRDAKSSIFEIINASIFYFA